MTLDPAGRVTLVTGGGSGIGQAVAIRLAKAGAPVALLGRRPEPLQRVAAIIGDHGGEAMAVPADLLSPKQRKAALGMVRATLGPIEILVNNAGIAHAGPMHRLKDEDVERLFELNVTVPFELAGEVLGDMRETGFGRIVNVASTAAIAGHRYTTLYTASKHALAGWTRSLSCELLAEGITVNAVCPGFVDTDIVANAVRQIVEKTGRTEEEARADLAKQNPLGRLVRPEEVAEAVHFMVGPHSGAMSGHCLVLDGGTQPV